MLADLDLPLLVRMTARTVNKELTHGVNRRLKAVAVEPVPTTRTFDCIQNGGILAFLFVSKSLSLVDRALSTSTTGVMNSIRQESLSFLSVLLADWCTVDLLVFLTTRIALLSLFCTPKTLLLHCESLLLLLV
jgi:hypothetical protein